MTNEKKPTLKEFLNMAKAQGFPEEQAMAQVASMPDKFNLTPQEKTQLQEQAKKQVRKMHLSLVTDESLVGLVGAKTFWDTYSGKNKDELIAQAYSDSLRDNKGGAMGQVAKTVLSNAGTKGSVTHHNVIAEAEKIYYASVGAIKVEDALNILGIPLDGVDSKKLSKAQLKMSLEDYKKKGGEELYKQFTEGAYIQRTLPELLQRINQKSLQKYAQTILKEEKPKEGGLEKTLQKAA